MRPRLKAAENAKRRRRGAVPEKASMRPRLKAAENRPSHMRSITSTCSFNEAAA